MPTNSYVQVPPDSTGKKLYSQEHTVDAQAMQIPVYHLGCGSHPEHIQVVDARGQASVRFAEGSPSMDAFGNLRIGEATVLGTYDYSHGASADLFQDLSTVGGSVVWNQSTNDTSLVVTSSATASINRTTVRYHHYQPGVSNLIIQTIVLGDSGKVNNTRRWGYFDSSDGIYWELDGTTKYVCIRSSTLGTTLRVAQANWNQDKLDGTGVSTMNLDLTKANFYFIDFAHLGVGEVRFGVLGPKGERNICHIFENPNSNVAMYMDSGCKPLRWENFNTGVVSGGSEIKSLCSAVYAQSKVDYTYWRFSDLETATPKTVTTNTPLISMRVKAGTHVGIYPERINVFVTGGSIKLNIVDDAVLTNDTWTISGESLAEADIAATVATGGSKFMSYYLDAGAHSIDVSQYYEVNDEGYHRLPDDSDSYTFNLVATKLNGTTVTVDAGIAYKELR